MSVAAPDDTDPSDATVDLSVITVGVTLEVTDGVIRVSPLDGVTRRGLLPPPVTPLQRAQREPLISHRVPRQFGKNYPLTRVKIGGGWTTCKTYGPTAKTGRAGRVGFQPPPLARDCTIVVMFAYCT